MNKIKKLFVVMAVILVSMVMLMANTAEAKTNQDVINYLKSEHTANQITLQIDDDVVSRLEHYLLENPVTNSEADSIINKLETAKSIIENETNATTFNDLRNLDSGVKTRILDLVNGAASEAGLELQINDSTNEVTVLDKKTGAPVVSTGSAKEYLKVLDTKSTNTNKTTTGTSSTKVPGDKLVYTGKDYTKVIKSVIAIVAIAIVGIGINKYARK